MCQRLPTPPKVGDDVLDGDAMARHKQTMQILTDLLSDNKHSPALFDLLETRKSAEMESLGAEVGERITDLTTMKSVPKEVSMSWVAQRSDMTQAEIAMARNKDEEVLPAMMVYGSQIPKSLRFPPEAQIKPVFKTILDKCAAMTGDMLHNYKAKSILMADGTCNWVDSSYKHVFSAGRQQLTIAHWNGDIVCVKDHGITEQHRLQDMNHDWMAGFIKRPQPPIKLHLFFKAEQTGPYTFKQITQSSPVFKQICEDSLQEWEDAKAVASAASLGRLDMEAAVALATHEEAAKTDRAAAARKKLQENLEAKRRKREQVIPVCE